jgi:hypothetical protein
LSLGGLTTTGACIGYRVAVCALSRPFLWQPSLGASFYRR